MKTPVLGGLRSGKRQLAEDLAAGSSLNVSYIAAVRIGAAEMRERINL